MTNLKEQKFKKIPINNPFIRDEVTWDRDNELYCKLKLTVLTVFLVPIRLTCYAIFCLFAWWFSWCGLYGYTEKDLGLRPLKGYRRIFCNISKFFYRATFFAMGIQWIKVKGTLKPATKAPILIMATHSSFCDSVIGGKMNISEVLAIESRQTPILGKVLDACQPIYVNREDIHSRAQTIQDILYRVNSSEDWPHIVISPEGILTNGKQLIHFKLGAFYPGLPVQPILLRYPNKSDTLTYPLRGLSFTNLFWKTLAQFHNFMEIEILPVYVPSNEEIADPKLYAKNVQSLMAEALKIPTGDYRSYDSRLMKHAGDCELKFADYIADVAKFRRKLGLETSLIEEHILKQNFKGTKNHFIEFEEFVQRVKIPANDISFTLFSFFTDSDQDDVIDFKKYLLHALFLIKIREAKIEHVKLMLLLYGDAGRIQLEAFKQILSHFLKLPPQKINDLFTSIDTHESGFITFEAFRAATEKDKRFDKLYSMMTYRPQESTNH